MHGAIHSRYGTRSHAGTWFPPPHVADSAACGGTHRSGHIASIRPRAHRTAVSGSPQPRTTSTCTQSPYHSHIAASVIRIQDELQKPRELGIGAGANDPQSPSPKRLEHDGKHRHPGYQSVAADHASCSGQLDQLEVRQREHAVAHAMGQHNLVARLRQLRLLGNGDGGSEALVLMAVNGNTLGHRKGYAGCTQPPRSDRSRVRG